MPQFPKASCKLHPTSQQDQQDSNRLCLASMERTCCKYDKCHCFQELKVFTDKLGCDAPLMFFLFIFYMELFCI